MPGTLVERLPLPNLKVYTAGSVLLVSVAVYHAVHVTSDPSWRGNATEALPTANPAGTPATLEKEQLLLNGSDSRNTTEIIADTMQYLMEDPLCLWALINMAYCALGVIAYGIQCAVFGRLRASETQRLKDRLWNYVFYKFIFVFGVINVQYMDEVLLWGVWFTLLGSLYLLTQLCSDRLDYAGASAQRGSQLGLLTCLGGCAGASVALCACALCTLAYSHSRAAFCFAECLLVFLYSLQTIARLMFQRYEVDTTAPVAYYTHLVFDAGAGAAEALDVLHMLARARLAPSLASLVLLLRLRALAARLAAQLRAHRRRARLQLQYPEASSEELAKVEDKCAICWQTMREARKLPCGHLFHSACLCRWVAAHASCPVCRRALPPPRAAPANASYSFNGSGSVWWLPSLSLEVSRGPPLDALAQQMQQMFPQLSLQQLAADLRSTRDAALTLDNVLDGRLRPEGTTLSLQQLAADLRSTRDAALTLDNVLDGRLRPEGTTLSLQQLAADLRSTRDAALTLDNVLDGRLRPEGTTLSLQQLAADLRSTRDAALTLDNVLDGRLRPEGTTLSLQQLAADLRSTRDAALTLDNMFDGRLRPEGTTLSLQQLAADLRSTRDAALTLDNVLDGRLRPEGTTLSLQQLAADLRSTRDSALTLDNVLDGRLRPEGTTLSLQQLAADLRSTRDSALTLDNVLDGRLRPEGTTLSLQQLAADLRSTRDSALTLDNVLDGRLRPEGTTLSLQQLAADLRSTRDSALTLDNVLDGRLRPEGTTLSLQQLAADLRSTRDAALTLDNVLDGRLRPEGTTLSLQQLAADLRSTRDSALTLDNVLDGRLRPEGTTLSLQQLAADLRSTRDAALTLDNVLDGRLRPEGVRAPPLPPDESFEEAGPPPLAAFAPTVTVPSPMAVRMLRATAPAAADLALADLALAAADLAPAPAAPPPTSTSAAEPVPSMLFPKDSSERERHLQLRKQAMIEAARRKYLEKINTSQS